MFLSVLVSCGSICVGLSLYIRLVNLTLIEDKSYQV